jgi:hypothetical protein
MPLTRKFIPNSQNPRSLLTRRSANLPALDDVRGAFTLVSSQNIDDACSTFESLKSGGTIKGTYTCRGEESDPSSTDAPQGNSKGNGGSSGSSKSNSTSGAVSSVQVAGATTFLGFAALLFGML